MRPARQRDYWEAAKVVGMAAAVILLSFAIAFALAEITFPERQRVEVPMNSGDQAQRPGLR